MADDTTLKNKLGELKKADLRYLLDDMGVKYTKSASNSALIELVVATEGAEEAFDRLFAEDSEEEPAEDEVVPVEEEVTAPAREEDEAAISIPAHKEVVFTPQGLADHGSKDQVDVIRENQYIRTYSKKVHGPKYVDIAKGMAGKDPRRSIVEGGTITAIRVDWDEPNKENPDKLIHKSRVFGGSKDFKEEAKEFCQAVQGTMFINK